MTGSSELHTGTQFHREATTILDVLKASLFTNEPFVLSDWQPLFEEMKQQTVAALPYYILPENAKEWRTYCLRQQGQFVRVMHAQAQLISLLELNGISCVILKGAAAARYYPYPTLRTMGDVDFLVKRCDLEKTASLLEENDFFLEKDKDSKTHHYSYSKDNISFELHWRLPIVSEQDEKRLSFFEEGIDHREWHEIDGYKFPAFPNVLNGLVLIFHIDQHLRSGLGLRQIVDWMMYVSRLSAEEWEMLQPLLTDNGVEKLARTVTILCQKYLGLPRIIEDDASLPVDELLSYILEKGNFGRKAGVKGSMASFSMSFTEKGGFFKRLQAGGLKRWKAAQKYSILRPFAWIYQGFRILGILVKNRQSPKNILEQAQHGIEQAHLIEALGLRMDRTITMD